MAVSSGSTSALVASNWPSVAARSSQGMAAVHRQAKLMVLTSAAMSFPSVEDGFLFQMRDILSGNR